jgi:small GTP-binding protein
MTQSKKICLLGASAVGKSSLVRRFVYNKFAETYRTTIGVHTYDKDVICDEEQVKLFMYDLEGKDDPESQYPTTYLGGAEGYMLVADVTRPDTLNVAKSLLSTIVRHRKEARVNNEGILTELLEEAESPFVLLLNKQDLLQNDLMQACRITEQAQQSFGPDAKLFKTSAKLDEQVGQAFTCLVRQMLDVDRLKGPQTYKL